MRLKRLSLVLKNQCLMELKAFLMPTDLPSSTKSNKKLGENVSPNVVSLKLDDFDLIAWERIHLYACK